MDNLNQIQDGLNELTAEQLSPLVHPSMVLFDITSKKDIIEYLMKKFKDKESWTKHLKSLGGCHYELMKLLVQDKTVNFYPPTSNPFPLAIKYEKHIKYKGRYAVKLTCDYQYLSKRVKVVFLNPLLRNGFAEYIKESLPVYEQAEGSNHYNNSDTILSLLEVLIIILKDKNIDRKVDGNLKIKEIKKILNTGVWKPIFSNSSIDFEVFKNLIIYIDNFCMRGDTPKSILENILRQLLINQNNKLFIFEIFGESNSFKSYYDWSPHNIVMNFTQKHLEMMKPAYKNKWIKPEEFISTLKENREYPDIASKFRTYSSFRNRNSEKAKKQKLNEDNLFSKAVFGLMAILGLVEIFFEDVGYKKDISAFDGIKFVRFTEIGILASAGKLNELPQYTTPENIVSFDKKLLRLTLSEKSFVNQYLFEKFGKEISPLKYEFSYKTVLTNAKNLKDVEKFINRIKMLSGKELHKNWKLFLSELHYRYAPFTRPINEIIIKLTKKDNTLLEILSCDLEIRKLIKKSEGLSIIVKKKDIRTLQHLLMGYGYRL